jgi:ketosteroid isomerase-like protein
MNRLSIVVIGAVLLLILGTALPARHAAAQASDIEQVNAANQVFVKAISARDIRAMEKVWAHKPYATFMGPLSTSIVVGWDGIKKAWEMRFNEFANVTISLAEAHVHANGPVAWVVGVEKVKLLRKNGATLSFNAFVTNVFEKHGGRWLMVSHQATPVFREGR